MREPAGNAAETPEAIAWLTIFRTIPFPVALVFTAVPPFVTVKVSVVGLATVSGPVKLLWLNVGLVPPYSVVHSTRSPAENPWPLAVMTAALAALTVAGSHR